MSEKAQRTNIGAKHHAQRQHKLQVRVLRAPEDCGKGGLDAGPDCRKQEPARVVFAGVIFTDVAFAGGRGRGRGGEGVQVGLQVVGEGGGEAGGQVGDDAAE